MRNQTLVFFFAVCCSSLAGTAVADSPAVSVASRVAAQSALFEERYQSDLETHPERATAYGDYRYNDRLDDYSPAAINRRHAADRDFLARLNAIPTEGFSEQDALSHAVLRNTLQQSETDRYIAWPAQALSYKLGQLKFRELRERAQKELGQKFDIRSFHDEMLSGGVLPLDLLDSRTTSWIRAQK
jgi:uncharacterized protein (DUF885 family)